MQLRNGKQYFVDKSSSDNHLTPYIKSIITLFKKYIYTYDYKNSYSINKTTKNKVIQQIRDYREFYYLIEYYFESIQTPNFSNFIIVCKNLFIFSPNSFFWFNWSLSLLAIVFINFCHSTSNIKTTNIKL